MAEINKKKKMTKKNTAKKTVGKASLHKGSSNKRSTTAKTKGRNLTKEEKAKLEKIERREKRINHLILAVVLLALSMFLIISMYTKIAGIIGKGIGYGVLGLFGYMGYVLPFYFLIYSLLLIFNKGSKKGRKGTIFFTIGFFILLSAAYSISRLDEAGSMASFGIWLKNCFITGTSGKGGGFIGMLSAFALTKVIGKGGAYIATIACMIIAALVTMNRPFEWLYNIIVRIIKEKDRKNQEKEKNRRKQYEQIVFYGDLDEDSVSEYKLNVDDYVGLDSIPPDDLDEQRLKNKSSILDLMKSDNLSKIGKFDKNGNESKLNENLKAAENKKNMNNDNNLNYSDFDSDDFDTVSKIFGNGMPETDYEEEKWIEDADSFFRDGNFGFADNGDFEKTDNIKKDEEYSEPIKREKNRDIKKPSLGGNAFSRGIDIIKSDIGKAAAKKGNFDFSGVFKSNDSYLLPPVEILKGNVISSRANETQELNQKAALLENTLKSFNVNAKVIKVSRGPAVTRFEVQPATGVKVNSIVRLQDDIALNLEAKSIRMEAPIPGKAAVGIEIENDEKRAVLLREVIESYEFKSGNSKITFAVGRDISGNSIVANLKDMPHLLIAGSTGSGKSVCVNSIIMSILFKARPDEVKLIMVDPKVVELSNYNGIPHLLIPVVTEASKAAVALNWAVKEMEERYRQFQEAGVRELASFNRKAEKSDKFEKMPQIVIIIDELADLMMAAPQQVEDAICRLAQKARAAGMHLIVATQRPSVDVITGVIKANIPSRIAFAVSSQIDSRTILDGSGAEKLVGKGDMLFSPLGMGKPVRVQGTFVSDEEVQAVIDYVSNQGHEQEFSNDLMDTMETSKMTYNNEEVDELLMDAIEHIVNVGQASVSMLQRRFRIGYNRAARLVDMMEERGIVGPQDGSRPRKVFLTKEGLVELDRSIKNSNLDSFRVNNDISASDDGAVPEEI